MKSKIFLWGGFLGGVAVFVWSFVVHMLLNPLWMMTMSELPNESGVVAALNSVNAPNGLYYGKSGILLSLFLDPAHPDMAGSFGPLLIVELISNILLAFVMVWLLLRSNLSGLWKRAVFGGGVGLLGWISINVSYWNWYHWPFGYILLEALDGVGGAFFAALVIAWLMGKMEPVEG